MMYRKITIKSLVFDYVKKCSGLVDYDELAQLVLEQFPASKWKPSHWAWYRYQIVAGRFAGEFSEATRKNLIGKRSLGAKIQKTVREPKQARPVVARHIVARSEVGKVERDIAVALAKVTHHVHPAIVEKIVKANNAFKPEFCEIAPAAINPEDYLYPGSACVFPGVRRHMDRQGLKKRNTYIAGDDGIIDSNYFPREFWCFLYTGRRYYPESWKETGLNQFELAHIFAHKQHERKTEREVFEHVESNCKPYGLFTCVSNVALVPRGLAKPTDALPSVKVAFYQRHIDLYGESILPGLRGLKPEAVPEWYSELAEHWLEPILLEGWEERVERLLAFRAGWLRKIFASSRNQNA